MTRLAEYWGLVPVADLERIDEIIARGELDQARDDLSRVIDQANESTILLYSEPRPGAVPVDQAYAPEPEVKPVRRAQLGWGERIGYLLLVIGLVLNLKMPVHQNGMEADLGEASEGFLHQEQPSQCRIELETPREIHARWRP